MKEKKPPKTNAERQKEHDDRQKELGRIAWRAWVTPPEKSELQKRLKEMRNNEQ